MSEEDELVAFDDPEEDGGEQPDDRGGVREDFVDELVRSQSQKKLDHVNDVEDQAKLLEQALGEKVGTFLQMGVDAKFGELFMFHRLTLAEQGLSNPQIALLEIENQPVACVSMQREAARRFLSIALVGKDLTADLNKDLSKAEASLFLLFTDFLATVLYQVFPGIPAMGIPDQSRRLSRDGLAALAVEEDWICFSFDLPVEGDSEKILIMVPLPVLTASANGNGIDDDYDQVDIDPAWRSALFDRIENLPMHLTVELASAEIPLSKVNTFATGEMLDLPIEPFTLKVMADAETLLLRGALEVQNGKLNLRVLEAAG